MKKAFSFLILCIIFAFACVFCTSAVCDTYEGSNVSAQNYQLWSKPVESYLTAAPDGKLMRFQSSEKINGYLVEYYNNTFDFMEKRIIQKELPIFGAFYETENNYFVLSGQENPTESPSVEVFRLTKYDKNWNRISAVSFKDCNTTVPFDAGSARMAVYGGCLVIRTSHEMYKSKDGLNHQSNITLVVDIASMRITEARTSMADASVGYVSHSFNQFVKTSGDLKAFLDHGDAYPRSVCLFTQKGGSALKCFDLLKIPGDIGENVTGVTVGGFEISSSSYLAAMSNVDLNGNFKTNKVRNVYVACAQRKADGTVNEQDVKLNRFTYYTKDAQSASTPQLVKISDNSFMLMWESENKVFYCLLDDKGNKQGVVNGISGNLSDCLPIVYNGSIVWYTWKNSQTKLYEIKLSETSACNKKLVDNSHSYEVKEVSGNTAALSCTKCKSTSSMKVASGFEIFWKKSDSSAWSVIFPTDLRKGDELSFIIKADNEEANGEIEISVSDPQLLNLPMDGNVGKIKIVGHGEVTVTFNLKYNPTVSKSVKINTHVVTVKDAVEPTCTQTGLTRGTVCLECNEVFEPQKEVPALDHEFATKYTVDKKPTCTESGMESIHCTRCEVTKSETPIPPTGHKFGPWTDVIKAGCTTKGLQTKTCSICQTVEEQESNAIGHRFGEEWTVDVPSTCISYGQKSHKCIRCDARTDITRVEYGEHDYSGWKISRAASCTNDGIETRTCRVCDNIDTRYIPMLGHKELVQHEVQPTCVKSGKTEGSYCIICGYVFTAQQEIPALGHDEVVDEVVEPTCVAAGKTEGSHCSRCKDILVKQEIILATGHSMVTDERVEPTCDVNGKTQGEHCEVCGFVSKTQNVIPATGHTLIENVTKRTCTTDGYTTHYCTVCEYSYRDSFDYAQGHVEETVKQIQETCISDGLSVKTFCTVCGTVFSESQVIPATGHIGKTTVVSATTKKDGKKTTVCTLCGKKMASSVIPKIQSVKLSVTSYVYDGKAKKPAVIVVNSKGEILESGKDYKVTYDSGRKKAGTYYVSVTFKGDYSGTKQLKFKIYIGQTKGLKLTAKSKSAVLKWTKTSGAAKYEIYYSTSKNGKYKKLATTKSNSYTVKKLTSGKVYYFKVRAVATDAGGKTTYGNFSSVKKVKVK